MRVTLFRSRLDPAHLSDYREMAAQMRTLAEAMPGFVSFKTFTADDGERISIVEFESEETLRAWREHPAHREAQRLGRERFYLEYRIQVCEVLRAYGGQR